MGTEYVKPSYPSNGADNREAAVHDPRCISLTDSEFNNHCDCETLRLVDEGSSYTDRSAP